MRVLSSVFVFEFHHLEMSKMEPPAKKTYDRWSEEETLKVIHIYEGLVLQQIFDGTVRDSEAYKKIAAELANSGIMKTIPQIKSKLKFLKTKYRQAKDRLRVSGAGGEIVFPYFQEMDKFLGNKDNVNPIISADIGLVCQMEKETSDATLEDFGAVEVSEVEAVNEAETFSEDFEEVNTDNMSVLGKSASTPKNKGRKRKRKNQFEEALGKALGEVVDKIIKFEREIEEQAESKREAFRQKLLQQNQEMLNSMNKVLPQ